MVPREGGGEIWHLGAPIGIGIRQVNGGANISTPRPELSASTSAAPPHASVSLYPQSQPKQPHISELNDGRSIKLAVPVMNGAQWAEVPPFCPFFPLVISE